MANITTITQNSINTVTASTNKPSDYTDSMYANKTINASVLSGVTSGIFATIPQSVRNAGTLISDFRLGTLANRLTGNKNGELASVIDASLDLIMSRTKSRTYNDRLANTNFSVEQKFVPIVLKTNQKLITTPNGTSEFFIIFDSTPDSISFTKGANWQSKPFLGRPEPVQVYSDSSPMTFSLRGMFFARSEQDLLQKINLGDALFALVTPSKNHYMPSTVSVIIGNWKELHCIVNSVSVTYRGPWWIATDDKAKTQSEAQIPSHAPYLFEADFSFTVVSEANNVNYAEDILYGSVNKLQASTNSTYALNDVNVPKDLQQQLSVSEIISNNQHTITTTTTYNKDGASGEEVYRYLTKVRGESAQREDRLRQGALLGVLSGSLSNLVNRSLDRILQKGK